MARPAKHNWKKLYLEYCQGRYKNVTEFAKAKKLPVRPTQREFRKLRLEAENSEQSILNKTTINDIIKASEKRKRPKNDQKYTPWEGLKKQFLDWPEDKLQAYLVQLEERKAELESIPFEELTPAEVKELGQVRRERRAILSDPDPEVMCHARKHDGSPCQNPAERGKRVCWNHGGAPGVGAPKGSQNNLRHGFYARIMPDDPEIKAIIEEIDAKSPLDILWDQIVIQYAVIARAQKLMYVRDQDDIVKRLKRVKDGDTFSEKEWEFQYPWDRHAAFLNAQSKAMATLEKLISRYEELIQKGNTSEEHQLRLEKLKQDMSIAQERLKLDKAKVMGDIEETQDDGFIEALQGKVGEAWSGYSDSGNGDAEADSEED